jgi:hypothetical protein
MRFTIEEDTKGNEDGGGVGRLDVGTWGARTMLVRAYSMSGGSTPLKVPISEGGSVQLIRRKIHPVSSSRGFFRQV